MIRWTDKVALLGGPSFSSKGKRRSYSSQSSNAERRQGSLGGLRFVASVTKPLSEGQYNSKSQVLSEPHEFFRSQELRYNEEIGTPKKQHEMLLDSFENSLVEEIALSAKLPEQK